VLPISVLVSFGAIISNYGIGENTLKLGLKAWIIVFPVAYFGGFKDDAVVIPGTDE